MARKKKNTWVWVVLVLVMAYFMYNRSLSREAVTGITTPSKKILYINEPVDFDIVLEHGNLTAVDSNGTVIDTNQSEELIDIDDFMIKLDGQEINATITEEIPNYKYNIVVDNPEEGYLTVIVKNVILTMDLRKPVVNVEYDIPIQTYSGETHTLFVRTLTPQGDVLDADKVILEILDPHTNKEVVTMVEESPGVFSYDYTFHLDHNYYFTIIPSAASQNYKSQTREATTVVMGDQPVPIFFYFMLGNLVLFVLILIIKNRKKIGRLF